MGCSARRGFKNMHPLVNIHNLLSLCENGETPRRGCGGAFPLMERKKIERRRQKKEGAYRLLSTLSMERISSTALVA